MPFCPNCGSYVSPGANICSCGTTFGYGPEAEKETESELEKHQREIKNTVDEWCIEAGKLMDRGEYLKAIEYFNKALEIYPKYHLPTFNKAKAYYYAGMYRQALHWFKKTQSPHGGIENYVVLEWIGDTLNELYQFDKAVKAYRKAIDIINEDYEWTINFHKDQRWDPPSDAYLNSLHNEKNERISALKDLIECSKKLKREVPFRLVSDFDEQEKFLKNIGKENFITITGTNFYDGPEFEKGMKLKLINEENNEFDSEAIAVYSGDVKVGYVANGVRTACYLTSQAKDVQIHDIAYAEYMFYFAHKYHIAKINIERE
ncbi:HIRAN domain-containing protein [Methanobrevibacter sp.]